MLGIVSCLAATGDIERFSSEVNKLVPADAKLEKISSGFTWVEGPVWMPPGYLLFADIPSNSIRKWQSGTTALFLQPSGYVGKTPFGGKEPGSNGMTLDAEGRLTVAGHARRNVWRMESDDASAQITVLADAYEGKHLNSPNDVVYRSDGSLYFTDPPYGLRTQSDGDPAKELSFNGVYRVPDATSQKAGAPPNNQALQLVVRDLPRPNGIAFSPDEKTLYVSNSEPKKFWMRYHVEANGSVSDGQVFFDASADTSPGAPDGLKVDREGNVYSAGPGGVWIFSPKGKHLGTIRISDPTANVAWGGPDAKTLFITASGSVYRIRLNVGGKH